MLEKETTSKTEVCIKPAPQPPVRRKRHSPTLPFGENLREEILRQAGITPQELGRLLKKALDKAEEKLEAKKVHFFSYMGKVYEVRELPDHDTQLSASKQIMELAGAFPSKFQDRGKGESNVQIVVNIPWAKESDPLESSPAKTVEVESKGPGTT